MRWTKIGQIYQFKSIDEFCISHASNPLAIHLHDDLYRVFFSGRDRENKSSVAYVDIDIETLKVVGEADQTLFLHGADDSFYSHGVSIGNMYEANGQNYILFMGWQIRNGGHWRGDIGRLRLDKSNMLVLDPATPFMSSDEEDPISLSYPWVMQDDGIYKMWYGSTITWDAGNNEMLHVIKYATSPDGEKWEKHGIAIPYALGTAQAFSRPSVIRDDQGYHMWFSYRSGDGTRYRIGYAHSIDGQLWKNRLDDVGIDVSPEGWDSEMICYPFVFDHKGKRYMLYNGNQYGKEGFGLAIKKE
ncbi:MAG: hypothetical protein AB1763_10485 [Campylobacterota bacterium]